jgi:transposase-like protein
MNNPSKTGPKSESEVAEDAMKKKAILDKVAESNLPTKTILRELGISRSTYYSWLKRYQEEGMAGLMDSRSGPRPQDEPEELDELEETEIEGPKEEIGLHTPSNALPVVEGEQGPSTGADAATPALVEQRESQRPSAEPVEIEPPKKKETLMSDETVESVGGPKKKGMGLYALVGVVLVVVALLLVMSLTNYSTYQVRQSGNTLTLWKGTFAPVGSEQVKAFEPIETGDGDVSRLVGRSFAGRDSAYKAVFQYLMEQATGEVNKGDQGDLGKVDRLFAKADSLVTKEGSGMAGPRFELAQKRVTVAEMALKRAYQKALPAYQEALRLKMADSATLKAQIEAMQIALGLAVPKAEEQAGKEGKTLP